MNRLFSVLLLVGFFLVGANCLEVGDFSADLNSERIKEEHVGGDLHVEHDHSLHDESRHDERKPSTSSPASSASSSKLDEKKKEELLKEKKEDLLARLKLDYFLKNPNTRYERECFANKLREGESIDFVIDVAPSPSMDSVDKRSAESPVALYLEGFYRSPTRAYFDAIRMFIDCVAIDMKAERTHSVIHSNGVKYYIRGKYVNDSLYEKFNEFEDESRNLKTLWPRSTKSVPETYLSPILVNDLGYMTQLALLGRDNGLPTVLFGARRSKPVYTIVITDGSSNAKLEDLTDDLSRTTLIDIGDRRFIKNLHTDQVKKLFNAVALPAPQALPLMVDTVRTLACRLCSHKKL